MANAHFRYEAELQRTWQQIDMIKSVLMPTTFDLRRWTNVRLHNLVFSEAAAINTVRRQANMPATPHFIFLRPAKSTPRNSNKNSSYIKGLGLARFLFFALNITLFKIDGFRRLLQKFVLKLDGNCCRNDEGTIGRHYWSHIQRTVRFFWGEMKKEGGRECDCARRMCPHLDRN